jgi:hypothetical protein
MQLFPSFLIISLLVLSTGCSNFPLVARDAAEENAGRRMQELLNTSDTNLTAEEMDWFNEQPSLLTWERIHGGIQ